MCIGCGHCLKATLTPHRPVHAGEGREQDDIRPFADRLLHRETERPTRGTPPV
jgi:hypothetical protein